MQNQINYRFTRYLVNSLSVLCAVCLIAPVGAEPVLEEVIVTAQKREQGLQDASLSLEVFTEENIQRLGITNVGDISNNVPNMRGLTFGVSPTTIRFYIRGIGSSDAQVTQDPPVGVYMDGVYLARSTGLTLDVADIERIEVLRGPQGTLYGRNTTGGAVNIITVKPSDEFKFSQLFTAGEFSHFRSKTVLNAPITDQLAVKLAYEHNERGGWIDNDGSGDDFNDYDRDALRFTLRWQLNDAFTIDYAYDQSENDYVGNYYHVGVASATIGAINPGAVVPQTSRVDSATLPTPFKSSNDETSGHALRISAATPFGEVSSITAFRELDQFVYNDYSGNPTVSVFQNDPFELDHEQFSQEFQLVGNTVNGGFDYVAGLYYFSEEGREIAVDRIPLFDVVSPRDITAENNAWAAYAELGWTPGGDAAWTVTVGGRYTADERKANNNLEPEASEDYNNFTPSLLLEYAVQDNVNLYAKVATGYKSGGFNLRDAFFSRSFNEETLLSYELGWKSELLARRLRFNGALFFMDYDDLQLNILVPNQPNPTLTQTQNAGKAEISGVETSVTAALSEAVSATVSYAYLDTQVKEVQGDDVNLWDLANAPTHSLNTSVVWKLFAVDAGALEYSVDYSWRSDSSTASRETTGSEIDAYGLLNMRLAFSGEDWIGEGEYSIAAWVRNLQDEEYFTDTFGSFTGIHADQIGAYGEPRTVGIDLRYAF